MSLVKEKKESGLILPDQDGVANLEIRRIQHELDKDRPEYSNGMPAEACERIIYDLQSCIESLKRRGVSSIALAYMGPDIHHTAQAIATVITERSECEDLSEIIIAAINARTGQGPDDEAG